MSPPIPNRPRRVVRRVGLLAVLLAACATDSALQQSRDFLEEGNQRMAYLRLDQARLDALAAGRPVDPALEAEWHRLRLRYLLEEAREHVFADRAEQALPMIREVQAAQPDNRDAAQLLERAQKKLANRHTRRGQDHLAAGEHDLALAEFHRAMTHVYGYEPAREGVEAVEKAVKKLHREAQEQFLKAIRNIPELRFDEARWHAAIALTRDPELERAEDVQQRAQYELALAARDEADKSREKGIYGAALMQYRRAEDLWSDLPGIGETIERMQREVDAQALIERAALWIRADRVDEARKLLAEAFDLSSFERGLISELLLEARKREGEIAYRAARDLELQGRKEQALAAFQALAKDWPDGLLDEKTRISTLQSDLEGAEREYAAGIAAEEQGDWKAALEHFQSAATYHERYRDVQQRIAAVQQKIQG